MMQQDTSKCRHCGGKMTTPKPITEGPRKGQSKQICFKCGHTEYFGANTGGLPPEYVARHRDELGGQKK
jgi:hypothetical protein